MKNLYYQLVLSSPRILKLYHEFGAELNIEKIKQAAFIEARKQRGWFYPDHYYKNYLKATIGTFEDTKELLTKSLEELTQYFLVFRNKRVYVKNNHFSEYQDLLCQLSPVTLIASAVKYNTAFSRYSDIDVLDIFIENLSKSALTYPYIPLLEELKKSQGVLDLHIHLNGTVEFDILWQRILESPYIFYAEIDKAKSNDMVKELYLQVDEDIDEKNLRDFLFVARTFRKLIAETFWDNTKSINASRNKFSRIIQNLGYHEEPSSGSLFILSRVLLYDAINIPHQVKAKLRDCSVLAQEAFFIYKALGIAKDNLLVANFLHVYILIQSLLNTYSVQQVTQCGFDQFQKFTVNEQRSIIESKSYIQRFEQLSGLHEETIANLEGRFAFKDNIYKQRDLLRLIVHDYECYKSGKHKNLYEFKYYEEICCTDDTDFKRMMLQLVGHFIKCLDNSDKSDNFAYICRQQNNLKRYKSQSQMMVFLLNEIPHIKKYVTGFDAANNEQYTPPEVFAPAFRYLHHNGYSFFTFHCGEDFVHLISGIRTIHEAVEYLGLGAHNRIGHGTAIGICPQLWINRVDKDIAIAKGEWLDNLIFCYDILKDSQEHQHLMSKIAYDIERTCEEIYKDVFSISAITTSWKLRYLDPILINNENGYQLFDFNTGYDQLEFELINKAKKENPRAFEILKKYHSKEVYKESKKIMYVKSNYLSAEVLYYLQEEMLKCLNQKSIAIESLPTSNVRISFYKNHYEHHIYRWLTGKWKEHNGTRPLIVLGADDAGIFATNVQNEYAHVFEILKHHNIDEREIIIYLKSIRDNSHALKF